MTLPDTHRKDNPVMPRTIIRTVLLATVMVVAFGASPALAHDLTGMQLSCTGLTGNASGFGAGPRSLQVRVATTAGPGTWVSVPFTGVANPGTLIPVTVSLSGFTPAPRQAFIVWNTGGHHGGSETIPVATFQGDCPTFTPPVLIPPQPPEVVPPAPRRCFSRRDFRVRVDRRDNHRFRAGYIVTDASPTPFIGQLRSSGRLVFRINWRGVPGRKHQIRYFAFWLQRHDGGWVTGKRRARLCTPRNQAQPRTLNLRIGVRVPFEAHS